MSLAVNERPSNRLHRLRLIVLVSSRVYCSIGVVSDQFLLEFFDLLGGQGY